jgi:hypothetical protein
MSQSLDDIYALLPDFKKEALISSQSSCCLIIEDLLSLIWIIFVV